MKIETKRCNIRSFEQKDIKDFMLYRNDSEWMQYQGFKNLDQAAYEKALLKTGVFLEGVQLAIIKKDDQKLIGDLYMQLEEDHFWLGYTINPNFSRQGYAFEVLKKVLDWIPTQNIKKVYAGVVKENEASIRLLLKLGFKETGEIEDDEIIFKLDL